MVIEAGVNPEYFLDKMKPYEIETLLKGLHLKNRESWEQTRFICYTVAQGNSSKQLKLTDIFKFSWDERQTSISADDKERLKRKSEEYLKQINGRFSNKTAIKK